MKLLPLLLALFCSPAAFACDQAEAARLIEDQLLSLVDPALLCKVDNVGEQQKSWWGVRYYPVNVSCEKSGIKRGYRVGVDEKTGACFYGT